MFDMNQGFNNGMYGAAPMVNNMYYTGQQMQPQKIMNVLSAEEIKDLQQNSNDFNLGLTQREQAQAVCNHRSLDGTRDSLTYDPATGTARCTICGYEFQPLEPTTSIEDIKASCDGLNNILQTIKIMWPDMAAPAQREFFTIIALITKIPDLFKFAAKNFNKHEFDAWNQQNSPAGMAMLQNLGTILGANQQFMGGAPMMSQPMYQQPQPFMGAPMQQPMGSVVQPQPMSAPMGNPFGYQGASQVAPQQGFAYTPQQAAPAPVQPTVTAPAAPVKPEEAATVTQQVTV